MPAEFTAETNLPTERNYKFRFVGGTAAITKEFGPDAALAYVSTGLVDITWSANQSKPGIFVGLAGHGFHATTASGIKGYSVGLGDYDATARKVRLAIWDASNNLVDLTSTQHLTITITFVQESIPA